MIKVQDFWFLGSIYTNSKAAKFTVTIYSNLPAVSRSKKRKYFRHVLSEDRILDFEEVNVNAKIKYYTEIQPVKKGDPAIFCYTNKKELLCGTRPEIEQKIIPLLTSRHVDLHSKLSISSFLKFHGRTYDLISTYEKSMKNELYFKISEEDFIHTQNEDNNVNPTKILSKLFKRQDMLTKHSKQLSLSDLALLQNTLVYFDKFCVSIETLLNDQNTKHKKKLDKLIEGAIQSERVELGTSFKESKVLLAYVVRSTIYIDQKKIDSLLSQKSNHLEKSVIEVGAKVDESLGDNILPKNRIRSVQMRKKEIYELDLDVQKIIDKMV
jgi:hypothetical protein